MKLHNGGALGLGTSRNVSGVSGSSWQQCCDGSFFSILLFAFSAIKGPAKELRLSFMSGEKYVNKIFLLFSGSESAEVSPNKPFESLKLSVEMTPAEDFFQVQTPLLPGFPESLTPPPARISTILSVGGVWIFSGITHFTTVQIKLKRYLSDPTLKYFNIIIHHQ